MKKRQAALLSVFSNTALITMKFIAGILSGSVSIISEAIHSGMDLLASFIALYSVTFSSKPADKEHPYGHGKIENFSGIIEGTLIFIAAGLIIKEAVEKLINPHPIEKAGIAITVMAISALVNLLVSSILYRVARQEDSIALEADALHLKTDVYTSAGVAVGLALIEITGYYVLDPVVAIMVALLIVKEAGTLCWEALQPLLDTRIPEQEEVIIREVLEERKKKDIIGFHNLKTRKSGPTRYVDFHLVLDSQMSVEESHNICDSIEEELGNNLPGATVHIHVEPDHEEKKQNYLSE